MLTTKLADLSLLSHSTIKETNHPTNQRRFGWGEKSKNITVALFSSCSPLEKTIQYQLCAAFSRIKINQQKNVSIAERKEKTICYFIPCLSPLTDGHKYQERAIQCEKTKARALLWQIPLQSYGYKKRAVALLCFHSLKLIYLQHWLCFSYSLLW